MVRCIELLAVVILTTQSMIQCIAQSSLADCELAAASFHSTCDTSLPPPNFVHVIKPVEAVSFSSPNLDALTSTARTGSFSCPITFKSGDSTTVGDACSWNRRLCVTCSISSTTGRTRIRIQSNGLPDHSYWMESTNPREVNIDFEVDFDTPLVNGIQNISNPRLNYTSSNDLNDALCTGTSTNDYNIPNNVNFQHKGDSTIESTNAFAGVSVTGLAIGAALQDNVQSTSYMQDSHFPITGLPAQIDTCLLHGSQHYRLNEGAEALKYTTASPCMFGNAISRQNYQSECTESNGCKNVSSNIKRSFSSLGSVSNTTIIGIAKDGHLIYGPTLSKQGGFDVCNGIVFDGGKGDGVLRSYGYVATTTFPYLVGCFGPATYPSSIAKPTCTTNPATNYIPWKDLYYIPPAVIPIAPTSPAIVPLVYSMAIDSSGESAHGEACADLKSMIYGDGTSTVISQVYLPYADHEIFFSQAWEVIPTVLSVNLEINPSGTAAANNVLTSGFSIGVYSVTTTSLIVRITPISGFVADSRMFQVKYKVVAARIGACTIRGAMEHIRQGAMKNIQHLSANINVPVITLNSAITCNCGTGPNIAGSAEIKAGTIFDGYISSNPHLKFESSHLHLPVIQGDGLFADSLFVAASGNCSLRSIVLQNGKGGRGGAVRVEEAATLTLNNVLFRNNLSPTRGGGLFVSQNSKVTILNSLFYGNTAKMEYVGMSGGGAIHNRGITTISSSTFRSNSVISTMSHASGGAIINFGQLQVLHSEFTLNEANGAMVGEGGALSTYRNGTLLDVSDCTFSNNSATHGGGAAYSQGQINMLNCYFEYNSALIGPTLRISPDAPQPSMKNISVHNNVCESEYVSGEGYSEFLKPDNFRVGPW